MFNEYIEQQKNPERKETNIALKMDSLFNEDYGKYAKYKNNFQKILLDLGFTVNNSESRYRQAKLNEERNESIRKKEPLKEQGDLYEFFIGKQFEKKGDLVVYNGMIHGQYDQGVDLVSFSKTNKTVNIVQCKNWHYRPFTINEIENIRKKLNLFDLHKVVSLLYNIESINFYLDTRWKTRDILLIQNSLGNYKFYRTLYLANENVVDLEIGAHLKMTSKNIFKYKNLKMVIAPIN